MLILEHNFTADTVRNSVQDIYVTGWLNPDYTAKGRLILIAGKRTYQTARHEKSFQTHSLTL